MVMASRYLKNTNGWTSEAPMFSKVESRGVKDWFMEKFGMEELEQTQNDSEIINIRINRRQSNINMNTGTHLRKTKSVPYLNPHTSDSLQVTYKF